MLLFRGKQKYDEGEILIYLVRGSYKIEKQRSYKKEFCNLIRRWKLLMKEEILIQVFFLVLSYYFKLVSLVEQIVLPSR